MAHEHVTQNPQRSTRCWNVDRRHSEKARSTRVGDHNILLGEFVDDTVDGEHTVGVLNRHTGFSANHTRHTAHRTLHEPKTHTHTHQTHTTTMSVGREQQVHNSLDHAMDSASGSLAKGSFWVSASGRSPVAKAAQLNPFIVYDCFFVNSGQ